MRRTIMRRLITITVLLIGLVAAPTVATWASSSLSASATQVRSDVTTLVGEYEATYGPRVSPSERAALRSMTREARRDMNTLVRLVRKAERTDNSSDWKRAHGHYALIRVKGDDRLDDARDIIAPRMSLAEQLSAWSQARTVMQDLDSLGAQLERRSR